MGKEETARHLILQCKELTQYVDKYLGKPETFTTALKQWSSGELSGQVRLVRLTLTVIKQNRLHITLNLS